MSAARDLIPRSVMTASQQRRIGALQAAKAVLLGMPGYGQGAVVEKPEQVLRLAKWIEGQP